MRLAATAVVLVALGMGIFELIMRPSNEERLGALALFGLVTAGILLAASLLPRLARRSRSLKATVVIVGATSMLILMFAVVASGSQMSISSHDLNLLWV
ncbi:MAG: hypothetical protein WCE80_02310, partial [Acidimicrobiia bacterium]